MLKMEVKVDRRWIHILYQLCGATTVHLEHEICLAVTATCLTCASMLSLYRSSFGSNRDCLYILFTHLWLSRHFLHRLLCTTNVGTSLSRPRLFSSIRNAWISISCGGQYFDVPTDLYLPHDLISRRASIMASSFPSTPSKSLGHHAPSSNPLTANFEALSRTALNRRQTFQKQWEKLKRYLAYAQPVIFVTFSMFSLWFLYRYMQAVNSYSLPYRMPANRFFDPLMVDPRMTVKSHPGQDTLGINADLSIKIFEAKYGNGLKVAKRSRDFVYSMYGMVSAIVIVGTVGSLWVYGRIMPPLPDLVAGYGGGAAGKGGIHKVVKAQQTPIDQPWSESYKSIVEEDRLVLHFKVMMLRLVEYMVLCVMLPRSEYTCRVTRHCEVEPMISEMGHPTLIGDKGQSMYNTLVHDTFQGGLIYLTVFVCTCIILFSQMIVLNRSHLALGSYSRQIGLMPKKSSARKVGTKNESSECDGHEESSHNQARMIGIIAKISKFSEQMMKHLHNVLANELGALSTSRILAACAGVHIVYTIVIVILWAYYAFTGKEWKSFALLYLALFGSSVEIGYLERGVLSNVSDEIRNHIQMEGKVF